MASAGSTLTARLIDSLYTEAMLLADETRGYFDDAGIAERDMLPPRERVAFACEALKGTTRLMQVIAWLLVRRAIEQRELPEGDPRAPERRLGDAPPIDDLVLQSLPEAARRLLSTGADLYGRVRRIADAAETVSASPAHSLLHRLQGSLR